MTSGPAPTIRDADVRSLAAKLKGLHALLTPSEQMLLHAVLRRAAGNEEPAVVDTNGFAWAVSFNPFTYLDAIRSKHTMPQEAATMNEQTDQTTALPSEVPASVAQEDVSGHAIMIGGHWWTPPGDHTGRPSNPMPPQLPDAPSGPVPLEPREPRQGRP